jgi:DNA invertase Pin-like site-specific DNA recombinase
VEREIRSKRTDNVQYGYVKNCKLKDFSLPVVCSRKWKIHDAPKEEEEERRVDICTGGLQLGWGAAIAGSRDVEEQQSTTVTEFSGSNYTERIGLAVCHCV